MLLSVEVGRGTVIEEGPITGIRSIATVAAAALSGCLAAPPDGLPSAGAADAGASGGDASTALDLVVSGSASITAEVGGPGGDDYDELCPEGRFVTGLDGTNNGAGMASVQAICSRFQLGPAPGKITQVDQVKGAAVVGDPGEIDLELVTCSDGLVVVGFHGSENGNEVVSHLQLSCAPLDWDGAAVVREPSEMTAELGSPDEFATADGLCDGGMVAGGISGRFGLLIDAFALDCFAVEAMAAEQAGLTPGPCGRTSRSCPSP